MHIAMALEYLHELQPPIMHRDMKLDNVMLSVADVSRADAKLTDFGLARDAPLPPSSPTKASPPRVSVAASTGPPAHPHPPALRAIRTVFGSLRRGGKEDLQAAQLTGKTGSLGYMAPEVLGCRPYYCSADVFSLGVCMYNLFARRIPGFELMLNCGAGEDPMEAFAAKVGGGGDSCGPCRALLLVHALLARHSLLHTADWAPSAFLPT